MYVWFLSFADFLKSQIGMTGLDFSSGKCQLPSWAQNKVACKHQVGVLAGAAVVGCVFVLWGAVKLARKVSARDRVVYQEISQEEANAAHEEQQKIAKETVLYTGSKNLNKGMFESI